MAGPRRPQDRVALTAAKSDFRRELAKEFEEHPTVDRDELAKWVAEGGNGASRRRHDARIEARAYRAQGRSECRGGTFPLTHGSIVIAAITSCTNTSNPSVMLAAGLLAKKAVERGLTVKPWVKTSLAPGSKVVTQYLKRAGLIESLEKLRFNLVGYGCTTCIGNSGPIAEAIAGAVQAGQPGGVRDSERQSQFRRAHQSGGAIQLPGVAAAGGRIRDRRHDGYRRRASAARHRLRRAPGLSARHLAVAGGSCGGGDRLGSRDDVQERVRRRCSKATSDGRACRCPRATCSAGREDSLYVKAPPFFDGVTAEGRRVRGYQRRARAGGARRQRHDRSHFAGRLDRGRQSGGKISDRAWRAAEGFQLVRRAARES